MAKKTLIEKRFDGFLAAGAGLQTLETVQVPAEKIVHLVEFGAAVPFNPSAASPLIGLQAQTEAGWKTIRALSADGQIRLNAEFTDETVTALRLIAYYPTGPSRAVFVWLTGFLQDPSTAFAKYPPGISG